MGSIFKFSFILNITYMYVLASVNKLKFSYYSSCLIIIYKKKTLQAPVFPDPNAHQSECHGQHAVTDS